MNPELFDRVVFGAVALGAILTALILILLIFRMIQKAMGLFAGGNPKPKKQKQPKAPQTPAQAEPAVQGFGVEREITFIHSQELIDGDDR